MADRIYTKLNEAGAWVGTFNLANGDLVQILTYDRPRILGQVIIVLKQAEGKLWPMTWSWNSTGFYFRVMGGVKERCWPNDILRCMAHSERKYSGGIAEAVHAEIMSFLPDESEWHEWLPDEALLAEKPDWRDGE